ncbi:MAG: HNH endonuclease signature motif containing protein [Actinomycetota bacterium]
MLEPAITQALLVERRSGEQLAAAQRLRIKKRDDHRCRYCGGEGNSRWGPDRRSWHIDHVEPRAGGGTNSDDNLALACATCNMAKHAKEPDDFEAAAQERALRLVLDNEAVEERDRRFVGSREEVK